MQMHHPAMLAAWETFELREGTGIFWTQLQPMKNLVGVVRGDDWPFYSADGMHSINIRLSNGVEKITHSKPYTGWTGRGCSADDQVRVGTDGKPELHLSQSWWHLQDYGTIHKGLEPFHEWTDREGRRLGDVFRLVKRP
jgi:hypothetical protein